MQAATEVSASCCLLDLPVVEADGSIPSQHSNLLLASTSAEAANSGQFFHCSDSLTQNGEEKSTNSDHIPLERLSVSDSGALVTSNDMEQSEAADCADDLSTYNGADMLSKIDDALNSYFDSPSEAV